MRLKIFKTLYIECTKGPQTMTMVTRLSTLTLHADTTEHHSIICCCFVGPNLWDVKPRYFPCDPMVLQIHVANEKLTIPT